MTASRNQQMVRFLGVALVAIMVACSWLSPFDTTANAQVDAGLKRAAATYASARLLNGAISVVQGTQISAAPAGMGMTFAPGEILDPLNDLVEQFSQVMLVAMVAFGVEKVLLTVGASWMVSLTLSLVAGVWAILYMRGMTGPRWLSGLLLVFLVTRFAMPLSLIGTDAIFQQFMASDYQESQEVLTSVQGEASKLGGAGAPEKHGLWEEFKSATVDAFAEAGTRLENLKRAAENAVDRIIKLMAIFVLQTIVLPVFFIWVLLSVGRGAFDMPLLRKQMGRQSPSDSMV